MYNTIIISFLLFFQESSGAQARLSNVETHKNYWHITCGTCATIWRTPMTKSMIGGGKIHSST